MKEGSLPPMLFPVDLDPEDVCVLEAFEALPLGATEGVAATLPTTEAFNAIAVVVAAPVLEDSSPVALVIEDLSLEDLLQRDLLPLLLRSVLPAPEPSGARGSSATGSTI